MSSPRSRKLVANDLPGLVASLTRPAEMRLPVSSLSTILFRTWASNLAAMAFDRSRPKRSSNCPFMEYMRCFDTSTAPAKRVGFNTLDVKAVVPTDTPSASVLSSPEPPMTLAALPGMTGSCTSPENPESWVAPAACNTLLDCKLKATGACETCTMLLPEACTLVAPLSTP